MNKRHLLLLFIGLATFSFSQKITIEEGDFSFLKEVTKLNVTYDYSEMGVGKFKTEKEYTDKKVSEKNKSKTGNGDIWLESWEGSRERVYQPKFESLFNKVLTKRSMDINTGRDDATYTLVVKTTFTEPGWNIGITKKSSAISFVYTIIETESKKVMLKLVQKKVPGSQVMGMDFDTSTRISESYAKGGKMLAGLIYKKTK
tara:strand:+ start:270 stop:872 length:603 start_codon:yes stop_codon:yes gene_type:complete